MKDEKYISKLENVIKAPRPKLPTQIQYQGAVPLELRRQKIQLKQKELELKEQKQTLQTEMYHHICDIQGDVIKVLTTLVKLIKVLKNDPRDLSL